MLKKLKVTGRTITNGHCGLVNGAGERVAGCGAAPGEFREYWYSEGEKLWGKVVLCPNCEPDDYTLRLNYTFSDLSHWGSSMGCNYLRVMFSVDAKEWKRLRDKNQLGPLYGVDLSNYLSRNGILNQYCVPVIDDKKRARNGRKWIDVTYYLRQTG